MKISVPMLTDRLADYDPCIFYADGTKDTLLYSMVNMVFEGQTEFDPDILYICKDSKVPSVEKVTFVICSRIRFSDSKSHILCLDYPWSPEKLFSEICSYFSFYYNWSEKADSEILKGCSLQHLLDLSNNILRNPCILLDASFNCLALSHNITPDDILYYDIKVSGKVTAETMLILSKNNKDRLFSYGHFVSGIPYRIADGPTHCPELFIDFKSDGNLVLAMNLRFSRTGLTQGAIDAIGIFAEKLQAYCSNQHFSQLNTGLISMNEYLFSGILDGNPESISLARTIPLFQKHYLVTTSGDDRGIQTLSNKVIESIPNACVFSHDQIYYYYIPVELTDDQSSMYILNQESVLYELGIKYSVDFGISGPFADISRLSDACSQALRSIELKKTVSDENISVSSLIPFRNIALWDIASFYCRQHPLCSFAPLSYIKMRENDLKYGTDHRFFVKTFIMSGCNSTKTGQLLFLHKNSVIYRLDKIKEKYDFNADSIHEQMLFLLAYYADKHPEA